MLESLLVDERRFYENNSHEVPMGLLMPLCNLLVQMCDIIVILDHRLNELEDCAG